MSFFRDNSCRVHEFLEIWNARPLKVNEFGNQVSHSYALWLAIKNLCPDVVIESGVYRGLTTWVIEQAFQGQIICLDPVHPNHYNDKEWNGTLSQDRSYVSKSPRVRYLCGSSFTDFGSMDASFIKGRKVLAFFDDHVSQVRRLAECQALNISFAIFDDNWSFLDTQDLVTIKQHRPEGIQQVMMGHATWLSSSWRRYRASAERAKSLVFKLVFKLIATFLGVVNMFVIKYGLVGFWQHSRVHHAINLKPVMFSEYLRNVAAVNSMIRHYEECPPIYDATLDWPAGYVHLGVSLQSYLATRPRSILGTPGKRIGSLRSEADYGNICCIEVESSGTSLPPPLPI